MLPQKAGFHAGRQGIKLGTSGHMERREVQTLIKSAEEWTSTILPGLLEEYRPNEVYNADETGL